jgi:glycosyltransferase involved in cell wall biosynthesis
MMSALRILHVITGLDIGGAESMLSALVTAPNQGLEHSVISLKSAGFHAAPLRTAGIRVEELGLTPARPDPSAFGRLSRLIAEIRPDLVQGWLYHGDIAAWLGLALSGRRRTTRLAWSVRCSNLDMAAYGRGLRMAVRTCTALSSRPDIIIANSRVGLAEHLALGYRPRRTALIYNGIDAARFAPDPVARRETRRALGVAENAPIIAHVARVDPMKDHQTLLDALALLPDVHCLAIGAGTESLPDLPKLHRLGRRDDISLLLPAADFIVSSSAYGEGFSNALAEGMAAGLPAAATDVGDAREIVADTGLIVPPRAATRLAAAIESLVSEDLVARRNRGEKCRNRILENFSLARAVAQFGDCYRELCKRAKNQ